MPEVQNQPAQSPPENLQEAVGQTIETIQRDWTWLFEKISSIGWSLMTAILVLTIGFWITGKLKNLIERRMIARDVDLSIRTFLMPIINIILKIMVIIPVISRLGLDASGFLAALGGMGLAVGLALQGSLSNFAGGLLIILFKPFKVGDYIVSQGNEGTVESISILNTVLVTAKGQVIVLPNANVFNNPITNYSIKEYRRLDVNIGIAYDDDFDFAKGVIQNVLKENPLIDDNMGSTVEILNFGDSSVNLAIRCQVKSEDYCATYWKLHRDLKYALDKNNISIPYPHTEMIVNQPILKDK